MEAQGAQRLLCGEPPGSGGIGIGMGERDHPGMVGIGEPLEKLDDADSVYEFDPFTGNIPATKVEITVSCR